MVLRRMVLTTAQVSYKTVQLRRLLNNRNINSLTNRFISISATHYARLYTEKHEWVEIDGKVATVGISNYAQDALGDVVFAQLPDIDTIVVQKDECGALESVKAASELYSPVSGRVVEKNASVEETPSLINSSCYDKGWLFKLELTNTDELKNLMDEKSYEEFLKTSEH